jgi:hypothetical protein
MLGVIWFVLELKNEAQKAEKNASNSLYQEREAREFADKKNKSFALLTKTTISTLIRTKNTKVLEYYIRAISDIGEKKIILDMLSELITKSSTISSSRKNYLKSQLSIMKKEEIIKLLKELISKRIEVANSNTEVLLNYWENYFKKSNSIDSLNNLSYIYKRIDKRNNDWIELKIRKKLLDIVGEKINSSVNIDEQKRLKNEITYGIERVFYLQGNINSKFISTLYQKYFIFIEPLERENLRRYLSINRSVYLEYAKKGEYNKASEIIKTLIDKKVKRGSQNDIEYLYYNQSKYQIMTGKYKDAIDTIKSYKESKSSRLQRNLAHAYLLSGNMDKAKNIYSSLNIYAIQKDFELFNKKGINSKEFKKIGILLGFKLFSIGLSLSKLSHLKFSAIALIGKKNYKENQLIEFKIDTMGKVGYLYIIYLDNKGTTTLLYPNRNSPLVELNGKYTFPRDFGNMNIRATKDCKKCERDETKIYAILTKKPIVDIHNITGKELKNFSSKPKNIDTTKTNIHFGMIQFFVQ